uniref:Cuticle protein n=1 Tax=Schizaphis graminum TaxID=13262 RepID=A0A2S2NQT1_SCHGA
MNTNTVSLFALVTCCLVTMSATAPSGLIPVPLASAPSVTASIQPVVTAYSSQYVARNYNGIAVSPAVVPSAAIVTYLAAAQAPAYSPTGLAYQGPLVQDYLF